MKKAATDLYTNESYLSREFKKAYGMSFVEYVSRKRIDASKKLLKETNLKVYEVAEKLVLKMHIIFAYVLRNKRVKQ